MSSLSEVAKALEAAKGDLLKVIPPGCGLTPDRVTADAVAALRVTKNVDKVPAADWVRAVLKAAKIGVSLEPSLQHGFLKARYAKKTGQWSVQLLFQYKGLIALALRSPKVSYIKAEVVYANDDFRPDLGEDRVNHVPALNGDRGEMIGAYCRIVLADGNHPVTWMPASEIEFIRTTYADADSFAWKDRPSEMWKKTVCICALKYCQHAEYAQQAAAIEAEGIENGRTPEPDPPADAPVDEAAEPPPPAPEPEDDPARRRALLNEARELWGKLEASQRQAVKDAIGLKPDDQIAKADTAVIERFVAEAHAIMAEADAGAF